MSDLVGNPEDIFFVLQLISKLQVYCKFMDFTNITVIIQIHLEQNEFMISVYKHYSK